MERSTMKPVGFLTTYKYVKTRPSVVIVMVLEPLYRSVIACNYLVKTINLLL